MIELLVAILVIGIVYLIANAVLPEPIPLLVALVLFLTIVLIPLLRVH